MAITNMDAQPKVRITPDEMEAFLMLPILPEGQGYELDEVCNILESNQVRHGIEKEIIKKMISERIYNKEICIAVGTPIVEGIDGYFDYLFNRNFSKTPQIRADGSVDYWSINMVEPVEKGQVIVVYKPPIEGQNGMTVKGKALIARRARELPPLKGTGFTRQEDGVTYTANMDGKIDMEGDRVIVSPVYEIFGNADLSVGNINFVGDVVIHGNVNAGVTVKATGSLTVDGVVESASIIADQDVVLRSGMVGGGKGLIKTKGNFFGKFVEYATLDVAGRIEADAFVGCEVICGQDILLNGKLGKIVGGDVFAVQGIDVAVLGSHGGVKTKVSVGAREDTERKVGIIEKRVSVLEENIAKIDEGLKNFEKLAKERGVSYQNDTRRADLLKVKIQETVALAKDKNELAQLQSEIDRGRYASVKVRNEVYPGVTVGIGTLSVPVLDDQERVEYVKRLDKIVMERL